MAPIHSHDDLSDLSPRNLAIYLAGVRGGDGDDDAPAGDAAEGATDAPATEGDAPAEGAPAEGDAPAEASTEGATSPEASIPALPTDLTAESPEDLQALAHSIEEARDALRQTARTQADLDAIREATGRRNAIAAELGRRIEEQRAVQDGLAALAADLENEAPLPEPEMALASVTPARPTSAQIAAARGTQPAAAQQASAAPARTRPRAALVAALSTDRTAVGGEMAMEDLGEALDRTNKSRQRTIVASLQSYEEMAGFDRDAVIGRESAEGNSAAMRQIREDWYAARSAALTGDPTARAAAICEPLDIRRDIPDAFNTSEPVRDMFPSAPATRLGFQYFRSVGLADLNGAVALWDEDDQAAVDPDDSSTWKPCLVVDCPSAESIKAEAVTACLLWDITHEMSNPENLANLMNALRALRSRTKEGRILQRIDALSHRYTFEGEYGAVPTVIEAVNTAIAQATYLNREEETTYDVILPPGLVHLLRIDLASRGFEGINVTDALAYVRDRVDVGNVVASLDPSLGGEPSLPFQTLNPVGQAAVALSPLSDTYRIRVIDPGAALYSETGQVNVGTTTDTALLRQNRTQYFAEEFLFLAKQGPAPWFSIDVNVCGNGARAGWIEPPACDFS